MNRIWILCTSCLIIAFQALYAQEKAEKVVSIVKDYKSHEWYTRQFELWTQEIKHQKKNGEAWENLYASARMAGITSTTDQERSVWKNNQTAIIENIEKNIKATYSYYRILSWENSIWQTTDPKEQEKIMGYTLKAHEIDPNNVEVFPELFNIYEVVSYNPNQLKKLAQTWKAAGDHSPSLMAFAYNLLLSTTQNSILITGGDNDTYPLWIAQYGDQFRTDVTVLNIYLATVSSYRNRIFKKLDIPELPGENLSFEQIIKHIIAHKKEKNLYFSSNGILADSKDLAEKLYCTGLLYLYAEQEFNNEALIVENFEHKLLTDHLFYPFYQSTYPNTDKNFDCMYLSGLTSLYSYYVLIDQKEKAEKMKNVILRIAEGTEFLKDVKKAMGLDN